MQSKFKILKHSKTLSCKISVFYRTTVDFIAEDDGKTGGEKKETEFGGGVPIEKEAVGRNKNQKIKWKRGPESGHMVLD